MPVPRIELSEEQQRVLQEAGGYAEAPSYVVMSKAVYRRMMGVESDEELQESLQAIERGLADVAAGRTRPFREFLEDFRSRHGIATPMDRDM